jgi:pyruvate formate lyase activating enzyme
MKEAAFCEKLPEGGAQCRLCPHECRIKEGGVGICRTRRLQEGVLYAVNYAQVASMAYDPIEKKPLYHFYPGSTIFSMGGNGCNLGCLFCQNWEISQSEVPTRGLAPEKAVDLAGQSGSIGIAYTYSEPLVWFEYVLDCAKLARAKSLKSVLVTNGLINPEPLEALIPGSMPSTSMSSLWTRDSTRRSVRVPWPRSCTPPRLPPGAAWWRSLIWSSPP